MNNNITELIFILDRSGSMAGMEEDVVGGFNSMIEKQKTVPGKAYVTTVLFSNRMEIFHDRVALEEIDPLTEDDFIVGGNTALLDAMGKTIHHMANIHKYARPEDVPEHTVVVINTDGMENASRHYHIGDVRAMVKEEEEKHGWEFLFLAANIDAVETAAGYGIRRNRAANYPATKKGTRDLYCSVSDAVERLRRKEDLLDSWADELR